jgi:hypothetical protein
MKMAEAINAQLTNATVFISFPQYPSKLLKGACFQIRHIFAKYASFQTPHIFEWSRTELLQISPLTPLSRGA